MSFKRGLKFELFSDNFRNARRVWLTAQKFDFIACFECARLFDCQIKTAASALGKTLDDVGATEANAEFEARLARLRDDEFRRSDAKAVADFHRRFEQAERRQIFAEHSER